MTAKTPLYALHQQAGAHFVDFAGWQMPLHYGSQIQEHHQVRQCAGLFDVSHMGIIDVSGTDADVFLRYVLANDVQKIKQAGHALYSCMLNEAGGVIDDLIVYRLADQAFRLVVNAATRQQDKQWLEQQAKEFSVSLNEQKKLCIVALQGPQALSIIQRIFSKQLANAIAELARFQFMHAANYFVARTGYTGEDGVEMVLPVEEALKIWQQCIQCGAKPCGLGARDTLRLEAGYNLYGQDMTQDTTPYESNLGWTVSLKDTSRDFIGRVALEKQLQHGVATQLVGVIMRERGVLRSHQPLILIDDDSAQAEISSGGFSPTLNYAIGLARIPANYAGKIMVERRGKHIPVELVKPPFVRYGEKVY